jgi:serine/threonine-protein kinase
VKVLDFGVAKILRVAGRREGSMPRYATQEGLVVGTPRSVAPEQAKCQPVDARTDIYAVGLLLYTLIVGHGPFAHVSDPLELLHAHVLEPPTPPSQLAQQPIPIELDEAILKALAKRPQDRFQTAEQFAAELERVATQVPGPSDELPAVTARGTLILRRPSPSLPVPVLAPLRVVPRSAPSPPWRTFIALTLASAVFFTGMILLAYRLFGGRG